jgi:hypothetical protein
MVFYSIGTIGLQILLEFTFYLETINKIKVLLPHSLRENPIICQISAQKITQLKEIFDFNFHCIPALTF